MLEELEQKTNCAAFIENTLLQRDVGKQPAASRKGRSQRQARMRGCRRVALISPYERARWMRTRSCSVYHLASRWKTVFGEMVQPALSTTLLLFLFLLPATCHCNAADCSVGHRPQLSHLESATLRTDQASNTAPHPKLSSPSSQLEEHVAAVQQHLESMQILVGSHHDVRADKEKFAAAFARAEKCKDLLESFTQNFVEPQTAHSQTDQHQDKSNALPTTPREQAQMAAVTSGVVGEPSEVLAETMCSAAFTGDLDTIRRLVEAGQATVDTCDYFKRSVLQLAVAEGHAQVVSYLVERGADLYRTDRWGASPFAEAVKSKHVAVKQIILKAQDSTEQRQREHQQQALALRARNEHWAVQRSDVHILHVIGEGDQGRVLRAEWRGMPVVCKMLKDQTAAKLAAFGNEVSVLAMLRHPNLVLFLGACLDWEPNFILTELLEGGTLPQLFHRNAIANGTPFLPTLSQVVVWATDLARALCCLHEQRPPVIHRDIKPSNLLLTRDGHLKLSDLGLSKVVQGDGENGPYHMTGATGTLRYMAPEVVRSEDYDAKVDVYSFGLVLWYMCTGELPLSDRSQPDLVRAATDKVELRPDLGRIQVPALSLLMRRCWAHEPKFRPSAHDLLEELAMISSADPALTAATPPR